MTEWGKISQEEQAATRVSTLCQVQVKTSNTEWEKEYWWRLCIQQTLPNKSHIFTLLLQLSILTLTLLFGVLQYFHKMKGRETLSRSYNDLNTTDDSASLRASLHQLSCVMQAHEFKIVKCLLIFLFFFTMLG
jgi:hypothetical protein